jgi:hypothetical protein
MQQMQDAGEPAAGCDPATAWHTDLEAWGVAEMPIMPQGTYAPPVHMIRLTETQEIAPYKWVHPDEERWRVWRAGL